MTHSKKQLQKFLSKNPSMKKISRNKGFEKQQIQRISHIEFILDINNKTIAYQGNSFVILPNISSSFQLQLKLHQKNLKTLGFVDKQKALLWLYRRAQNASQLKKTTLANEFLSIASIIKNN